MEAKIAPMLTLVPSGETHPLLYSHIFNLLAIGNSGCQTLLLYLRTLTKWFFSKVRFIEVGKLKGMHIVISQSIFCIFSQHSFIPSFSGCCQNIISTITNIFGFILKKMSVLTLRLTAQKSKPLSASKCSSI